MKNSRETRLLIESLRFLSPISPEISPGNSDTALLHTQTTLNAEFAEGNTKSTETRGGENRESNKRDLDNELDIGNYPIFDWWGKALVDFKRRRLSRREKEE